MLTNLYKKRILTIWERTLTNCWYYYNERAPESLMNEVGTLRGLYYAAEACQIKLPENDIKAFKKFNDEAYKRKSKEMEKLYE